MYLRLHHGWGRRGEILNSDIHSSDIEEKDTKIWQKYYIFLEGSANIAHNMDNMGPNVKFWHAEKAEMGLLRQ